MTTLTQVNRALAKTGIPLELERGDGYHYFIFDRPDLGLYETVSEYIPYTSHVSVERWVDMARSAMETIRAECPELAVEA